MTALQSFIYSTLMETLRGLFTMLCLLLFSNSSIGQVIKTYRFNSILTYSNGILTNRTQRETFWEISSTQIGLQLTQQSDLGTIVYYVTSFVPLTKSGWLGSVFDCEMRRGDQTADLKIYEFESLYNDEKFLKLTFSWLPNIEYIYQ